MADETIKNLTFPDSKVQVTVAVDANMEIYIEGESFDKLRTDILGQDLLITNPETGAQIILQGMALLMFDEELAPKLFF